MELRLNSPVTLLLITALIFNHCIAQASAEGFKLPDQSSAAAAGGSQQATQNVQQIFPNPQQQQQPGQAGLGNEQGRSSILSLFGLGNDNDPYLSRTNGNCLTGDLSECFKTQALQSFDEVFYRDSYPLTDFARVVRLPETQQRSLLSEPFEYSEEPRGEDSDWDQLLKYGLRRAERFIKSTALEVELPEEFTEEGRYEARFIGNDIDSELDIIEDKHAPTFKRKNLKKMIIPLLLVLKIFKLKLLLFLPFILGIVGLKKILSLGAIILPGLFAYFKFCRPPPGAFGGAAAGGGIFSGLFGKQNPIPAYSPQGVGQATYYHHHEHFDGAGAAGGGYRQEPHFAKPYGEYYSSGKNYEQSPATANAVSFGDSHDAAYSGYYGRSNGKDVEAAPKI